MQIDIQIDDDPLSGATLFQLWVDGEKEITAHDADPEDATFNRNFNAFLSLDELLDKGTHRRKRR